MAFKRKKKQGLPRKKKKKENSNSRTVVLDNLPKKKKSSMMERVREGNKKGTDPTTAYEKAASRSEREIDGK